MSKAPVWDAHLAWSGGVESTALLAWAIRTGHNVKVFHQYPHWDNQYMEFQGTGDKQVADMSDWKKVQYEACKKMEAKWLEPLGINVHYCHAAVESKAYGRNPWSNYEHSDMHHYFLWMYFGVIFTQVDPCKTVWYGDNYGLDGYGDGKGDEGFTVHEFTGMDGDVDDSMRNPSFQLIKKACEVLAEAFYGPDRLQLENPIPHRSKAELWDMIPDEVKPLVFTTDMRWVRESETYKLWRAEHANKTKT